MTKGQDIKTIERTYDTVAREYTEVFYVEHAKKPKDQEILQRFAERVGNREPVWDFGCGPGQTTKYLNELGIKASGLDLSSKLLAQARRNLPELIFQKGNILDLDFEDDAIAGVVAFYAIVNFSEQQVGVAFQQIYRVLKPGGLFLCTFHIGEETLHLDEFLGQKVEVDFFFFEPDAIVDRLIGAGFESIEVITREPYPGVEYESRRAYVFAVKPPGRNR